MNQQKFIDRKEELNFLEEKYKSGNSELIIIYGRRRIGKTRLIMEFAKSKPHIYYLCEKTSIVKNVERFKERTSSVLGLDFLNNVRIEDFVSLFQILKPHLKENIVIIFDEFPYLIELDRGIVSQFQKIWDEILSKLKIMIILCGSSIGMMENEVLGYKSPLYGRRTGQIKLRELEIKYIKQFLPSYSFEDILKIYGVVGGIPLYLLKLNPNKSFEDNIKENFLDKNSFFYEEAENILRMEFREPKNYMLILRAISEGNRKYGEIISETGLDKAAVSRYIEILETLDIVGHELPILESPKSKKRLYFIKDNYMNFWFRFIYPNKSNIEEGKVDSVLDEILENYSNYFSPIFEKVCKKVVVRRFSFNKVGRQWGKTAKGGESYEIDILALNDKTNEILLGECKWKENVDAKKVVRKLKEKSENIRWNIGNRKEMFAVFAKSFKKKIDEYEGRKVYCYDLNDLEKALFQE